MGIICLLLRLVFYALLAWIILSYVAAFGRLPWGHPIRKIFDFLDGLVRPVLEPIRRIMPPLRLGGVGLDLSPLVLFLILGLITSVVC